MNKQDNLTGLEIAIIGMAGRFPGANDIETFRHNLEQGIDSTVFFSAEELLEAGVSEESVNHPAYVKSKQKVEGKEYFDSSFFGYTPDEARIMDPQVRLFHECVWTALEDAGYNPNTYPGLIGVYGGCGGNFQWEVFAMFSEAKSSRAVDSFTAFQLRNRDFLTQRVSHKLNLKGPAVFIQTACSTSLVAVHMASRGILTGDCNIALAGGITITPSFKEGHQYQEGMISSPDGHCRAFDSEARGTVGGEGAGVVVLKKLKNALADRDHIYAVIKGTAINNDGIRKVGFSAPSVDGQADVIRTAHKISRLEPRSIGYIEAHGTGTVLGDTLEIEALTQVFGSSKEKYCALGSVKTNIGHLNEAAGVTGLIKTALALKHGKIPPSLHYKTPNPKIDFHDTPFYVNTGLKEWKRDGGPLRAGVSSFGIGGTNAHVVLEEAPLPEPSSPGRSYHLFMLSARTAAALERRIANFLDFCQGESLLPPGLENHTPDRRAADIAYTLQVGREEFLYRCMWVCRDIPQAVHILSVPQAQDIKTFTAKKEKKTIIFMFPGQGAQYVNMGKDLYQKEHLFREEVDRCFEILKSIREDNIKEILYPAAGDNSSYRTDGTSDSISIDRTEIAQPLLFIIEYALAKLLIQWGIIPGIMIGHSIGEYTAACISGVLSLADALKLVMVRGKLMQGQATGTMLSVPLAEKELEPLLKMYNRGQEKISLAAVNSTRSCVVSGPESDVSAFQAELKKKGYNTRLLHTSHAFHSPMMEPVLAEFAAAVKQVTIKNPQIPYISNLTGKPIESQEVMDPGYWSRHLRQTVRFSQGVKMLLEKPNPIFIEVGPGNSLSTFISQQESSGTQPRTLQMLRHPQAQEDDQAFLLAKIGELWLYGYSPDWNVFYQGQCRQRVSLPTYSFEKLLYPVEINLEKLFNSLVGSPGIQSSAGFSGRPGPVSSDLAPDLEIPGTSIPQTIANFPGERPELTTPYIEPTTAVEKKLARIWEIFFGIRNLGIRDDFFQLGGDSLKAMTLSAQILQQFQVEIPVRDFFAYPTIQGLAARIDSSAKKTAVFINPVEEKEYYKVSSQQRRLYFYQQLHPDSAAYNLLQPLALYEDIEKPRLEEIFRQLIHRHESLRTSFHTLEGEPVQEIKKDADFEIEYYEVEAAAQPGEGKGMPRGADFDRIARRFVRPYDLAQAPLIRVGLIKIPQNKYLLVVDIHHIAADGISLGILARDFQQLYGGGTLSQLDTRYRDYSEWQQGMLNSDVIKEQETYWLKQFADGVPVLNLSTDYPPPPAGAGHRETGRVGFRIDSQRLEKIKPWAPEGITLFFVLLAVYDILLGKYSRQEDIVVGTAAAGRNQTGLQQVLGLFISVLALRNYPQSHKTFRQFLAEVKQHALDAYANQHYPFEKLVRALNIRGNTPGNPLFSVAFELLSPDLPDVRNKEAAAGQPGETGNPPGIQTAHYDLTIYSTEMPDSVEMTLVYYADLFKPSTAEKMTQHYIEILDQVLENNEITLKEIEVLSAAEKTQLLFEFNPYAAGDFYPDNYPGDRMIQQIFAEQVEKGPDRLAVVYEHHHLAYRELNERANALAYLLRAKGVAGDTLVALVVEPSLETAVGILAILKAGGGYLPIHHETPGERLLSLLNDSRVSLVLTKNQILRKQSFAVMQGLRREEMKPYQTKPRQHIIDFDSIPFPDRSLVNYEKYNLYIGHNLIQDCISLQATRGCPFNCAYCHKIWPKTHVTRSAENIFAEVQFNYNLGIRRFSFVDDIINFDRKNSRRFFELIIENRLDLHIFCLMRGDMLTTEYIDLVVEAGLVRLGLALETASPRLQKLIGKHLDIEKLRTNLEYIAGKYPHVILELYTMHGFPTETKEEAMMTMNFIKSIKWLHFPYIFVLTIYPNTEMEKLALDNGIPREAIDRSLHTAYHELPDTLPFEKDFSLKYQAEFLNDYFLSKERLRHVLPQQMKILTEAEMVQKYNSYLPIRIKSLDELLEFFGLEKEELTVKECMDKARVFVPHLNEKFKEAFPAVKPAAEALRVLLLDLSQNFSWVHGRLDEMIEPPLGLMYLLTYLNRQYQEKINGKIAKALIDFDNYGELKALLDAFQPQVIGIRTLSLYKDFFHETVQEIRHWGITIPIITGGPYATSSYQTLLQDPNIDLVVLGEGEITLAELIGKILANNGKLPSEAELKEIAGLVFIPGSEKRPGKYAREIIALEDFVSDPPVYSSAAYSQGVKPGGYLKNPEAVNRPHHLAYSIFTSGSTGRPKGVLVEHRNVSRLLYGLKERIYSRYSRSLKIGLVASYGFDASVKQIFAALLEGHALHIVPENTRGDGPALLKFYKDHCIDLSDGTPPLIRMLLETLNRLEPGAPKALKHFVIGGEALPKETVVELFNCFKENSLTVTNVYGPTEGTVDSTSFEVALKNLVGYEVIPIGKPMPFDGIYILSKENRLVPQGVPGELCIGGGKLARGYLNNPALTLERFIEIFFNRSNRSYRTYIKLYKTGDLVRWLLDGNIEFLGRVDFQVKVRGIRIELGEIENRLAAVREIKAAVVTIKPDEQGNDSLCAYITAENKIDTSQVRRNLAQVLPDYMIPVYFVQLSELPVTPGGKIDRSALPQPAEVGEGMGGGELAAPRNEVETHLVEIIQRVLGRKRVGIYENIFTIGADSIKTIQIAYGMKQAGYNLEIKDIFESPTAAALAPKVSKITRAAAQEVVNGEVPLSPVQEEFFWLYQIDPHHFNHSVMFYSGKRLDPGALEAVVIKLQEHHDALRMTYKRGEEGRVIQWNHGPDYPHWFQVYDFRNREDALGALENTCNQVQASIDLEKGPLLKVALFQLDDGDRLLVVLHHLVVDGMSWRILFEDIGTLYSHYQANPANVLPQLPPRSDSFKLWGERLREYANNPEFLKEKNYWARVESTPVEPIKRDFPEETTFIKDMEHLSFNLTEAETERLITKVTSTIGVEVWDILLTGLGAAFNTVFNRERVLVALEGHGREPVLPGVDVGRTVGWFTSIYPVILDFTREMDMVSRLGEIKSMLEKIPHKGIGYGILKYITAGEHKKEIDFKLEPQIGFNYLGQFDTDVERLSFVMARESPGEMHSRRGIRKYDFTVTALVGGGQLMVSIVYSRKQYKPGTLKAVLSNYQEAIHTILQGV